jgi:hypothetical protein
MSGSRRRSADAPGLTWLVAVGLSLAATAFRPGAEARAQPADVGARSQAQALKGLIADLGGQLAKAAVGRRLAKVGVVEFTQETGLGEAVSGRGYLGRWCADALERTLVEDGRGRFGVIDRARVRRSMADQQFKVDDLGSGDALRRLSQRLGGLTAVALGTIKGREGRVVSLQCKLVRVDDGEVVALAEGTAVLNASEWAMLGRSAVVRPEDRGADAKPSRESEDRLVERLDLRSEGPHPAKGNEAPLGVRVMVGGRERAGVVRGNDYLVPVRDGDVYAIEVENRTGQVVCMRLLVDGLNTLPEGEDREPGSKGLDVMAWGRPVKLDEARHYVLDPAAGERFAVRGFVTRTGQDGRLREFTVVRAENSLAARQQFTESIGLITAAFYDAAPAPSGPRARAIAGPGTAAGREVNADIREAAGVAVGPLRAVFNLRLVNADELRAAQ